jgi:HSP20 family protein
MSSLLASRSAPSWFDTQEGQLSIDLFRAEDALILRAPMAGVSPEQIDIAVDGDLLTIRGSRASQRTVNEDDWFYRECYWGTFSRSIVLPLDVDAARTEAVMKDGVLEVRLPLLGEERRIPIRLA